MSQHFQYSGWLGGMFLLALCTSANASNESSTVESLDSIISQSSDMPELLMTQPIASSESRSDSKESVTDTVEQQTRPLDKKLSNPVSENILKNKLNRAQEELSQQKTQIRILTKDLNEAANKISAINKQHVDDQQLATSLAQEKENVKVLTQKLDDANGTIRELRINKDSNNSQVEESRKALQQSENRINILKSQLSEITAKQIDTSLELAKANALENQTISKLKSDLEESNDNANKKGQELVLLTKKNKESEKEFSDLKAGLLVSPPDTDEEKKAYSLGANWGQEIIDALNQLENNHVKLNLQQVSSGVNDAIKNELKLPRESIAKILTELTLFVSGNSDDAKRKPDDSFTSAFVKTKGVKKSPMGYYYLIQEKGTSTIKDSDVVEVTVKESLPDGKVIKDMAETGRTLTLPLDKFPPLFSSAIGLIGDQGKIKMVVPPELAYGEQGRPPEIPPASTMVYEVTVKAHQK
jgi:FKBP-type peptidyl-prolyl cis-trans isomerase